MTGQDAVNVAESFNEQLGINWRRANETGWRYTRWGCAYPFVRSPETY